jgi:hypothetical protein
VKRARLVSTLAVLLIALLAAALGGCAKARSETPAQRRAREGATIERIRMQVAQVRGLTWKTRLDVRIVSKDELRRRLQETETRDARPERDRSDEALLKLLKLIPAGLDLQAAVHRLLADQVVGFYDPQTKLLFVARATDGKLSADTQVTVAHELDHALTDQYFDFGAATRALEQADRAEELTAYTALIEGDAVLLQSLWAQRYLSNKSQGSLGAELTGPGPGDIPRYLRSSLVFPYTKGLDFTFERYRTTRNFAGVDAAWRRPPTSTEEILHPERYAAGQQWHAPALPDVAAATGCTPVRSGTLGEFDMREVLAEHLSELDADRAADDWAGDAFSFVRCGTAAGLVDRWTTDNDVGAGRLAAGLGRWAQAWAAGRPPDADGSFSGPGGAGRVVRNGAQVDLVLAADAPTARRLAGAIG